MPPTRKNVSHTPDDPTPSSPHRVHRMGGSAWSGVGYGVERTEPIRFSDETLRVAVQEWQRDRGSAMVKYGPIADWDTSQVTDMSRLFADATTFNEPLTRWDTSNVRSMSGMFGYASAFNQQLDHFDTSRVTQMSSMFYDASAFNQPLNNRWNTSNVVSMLEMFTHATAFNQPLAQWDTSRVENMAHMFRNASAFNQPLNDRWDTSNVVSMESMFHFARSFNQPLDHLDTSRVNQMSFMFCQASAFNQPLNNRWNTSNVVSMVSMFSHATAFNQPLAQWDTSRVEDMLFMFWNATAFNQPLSRWNTRNVRKMDSMFENATAFNQPLTQWDTSRVENMRGNVRGTLNWMFRGATAFNPDWAPVPSDEAPTGRLQWEAQRHAWQAKWTAMQQQKPATVARVRKAHRALYDEWPEDADENMCRTCFERPRSVVFVECRHVTQCDECYARWASAKRWVDVTCPTCRTVSRVQHIDEYLSEHTLFLAGGQTPTPPVVPTMRSSSTLRRSHHSNPHSNTVRGRTRS